MGIMSEVGYHGLPPVLWRDGSDFELVRTVTDLLLIAATEAHTLTEKYQTGARKSIRLGLAFPGPERNGLWYSNNLTEDFESGVDLIASAENIFSTSGFDVIGVDCVLDAQADAGAEIYHPSGALGREFNKAATVINFATGIAVGLIAPTSADVRGRVLTSKDDFVEHFGMGFDNGAGQIGRHVLFDPKEQRCVYRFSEDGQTSVSRGTVRLTEYLSGPAIASRFLMWVSENCPEVGLPKSLNREALSEFVVLMNAAQRPEVVLPMLNRIVRSKGQRIVRDCILLINKIGTSEDAHEVESISGFLNMIVNDFEHLLILLRNTPAWKPYTEHVVLTGGIGQNLFTGRDLNLLDEMNVRFGSDVKFSRSILRDGCERAAHYFYFGCAHVDSGEKL